MSEKPDAVSGLQQPQTSVWRRARQAITDWEPVDLVIRLTLVMLLLYSGKQWYEQLLMVGLSLCALVIPSLSREPKYWFLLFAVRAIVVNMYGWPYTDNHHYLMTYWCLALGLALQSGQARKVLAVNGRLMLGLAMLFAVIWKGTSWEYLDGTMFHFLLYENSRFAELSRMFGDFDRVVGQPGQSATQYMLDLHPTIQLGDAPQLVWMAQIVTWWTIFIESVVACLFLFTKTGSQSLWRHAALQLFIVTTYPIATVITFAWVLIIFALAECPLNMKRTRATYVLLFLILTCFSRGALRETLFGLVQSLF